MGPAEPFNGSDSSPALGLLRGDAGQGSGVDAPAEGANRHGGTDRKSVVLHLGAGGDDLPRKFFPEEKWDEVRFDLNPAARPHILGTITDLSDVPVGSVHAIYISHCLEHVHEVEAWRAVQEMIRVLHPEGFVLCEVPNLTKACQWVVEGGIMETAYWSSAGPIRPVDMLYGFQPMIAEKGGQYMTHRFGYTRDSLGALFHRCGFGDVTVAETGDGWELTVVAFVKEKASGDDVGGREAVCGASERGAGES